MTVSSLFEERQYLHIWSKVLMIGVVLLLIYLLKEYCNSSDSANPMEVVFLTGILLLMLLLTGILVTARLETSISEKELTYRFYPFQLKPRHVSWREVTHCYTRRYRPIMEYGGWGLRTGFSNKGNAVNASGCDGLQLVFENGKRLLIGTQKPDEVKKILIELALYKPENKSV